MMKTIFMTSMMMMMTEPASVMPVRMMPNEESMIGMRAKAEDQEIY